MSRANSLKKAVRQIVEQAERTLDEQNAMQTSRSTHSASQTSSGGQPAPGLADIKLVVTHPDDSPAEQRKAPAMGPRSAAAMPMALLQLYSAIGQAGGDSSSEPSPCPSPIPPVVPSLTTNFPLLPTSPIRYPMQPGLYRLANPPNTGPQTRPRSNSDAAVHRAASPRPPARQESAESEGDEDREAMLSLQVLIGRVGRVR